MRQRVDYDSIAPLYDARYEHDPLAGVALELRALAERVGATDALEVGCGTGRWLQELRAVVANRVCGLDFSGGMLRRAASQAGKARLVHGDAARLPFAAASFDLVYAVNALHHFTDKPGFIGEARRVLGPGGALAVVSIDPHIGRDRWYLYDYFEGLRAVDWERFPSAGSLLDWMLAAGFRQAEWRVAESVRETYAGPAVWGSPFIQRFGTSQLALLSDEAYAAGIDRMRADIASAHARGREAEFTADLWLTLLVGWA